MLRSAGEEGKSKMHELYLLWLSGKGQWGAYELTITSARRDINDCTELYEFLTPEGLEKEVGADLAKDLMVRHADAENKLPNDRKGQFIRKILNLIVLQHACVISLSWALSVFLGFFLPRNPQFPDNMTLWRYKCFVGVSEKRKRRNETGVALHRTAEVDEDDFHKMMSTDLIRLYMIMHKNTNDS